MDFWVCNTTMLATESVLLENSVRGNATLLINIYFGPNKNAGVIQQSSNTDVFNCYTFIVRLQLMQCSIWTRAKCI